MMSRRGILSHELAKPILAHQELQLFGNIGIIDHAGEEMAAHSVSGGANGEGGMCTTGPSDAGFVVEGANDGIGQDGATGEGAIFQAAVKGIFQFFFFGAGEVQTTFATFFAGFED